VSSIAEQPRAATETAAGALTTAAPLANLANAKMVTNKKNRELILRVSIMIVDEEVVLLRLC